jgi:hypothetical protein
MQFYKKVLELIESYEYIYLYSGGLNSLYLGGISLDNPLLNKLSRFLDENTEFELYFIKKNPKNEDNPFSSYHFELHQMRKDFRDNFIEKLQLKVTNKPVVNFDVVSYEEDSIEVLDSAQVNNLDKIKPILNKVVSSDAIDKKMDVNNIWGCVAILTNKDGKQMNIFRKYVKVSGFKAKKQYSIIGGKLTKVENKDSIFLDFDVDAIETDGKMYVANRYYFHLFFSFNSAYVRFVEKSLDDLKKEDVIENFDDFAERCLNSGNLTRKLVKVIEEDRLKWLNRNISKIPDVINEFNLKVKVENNKIIYTNKDCNISDVMKLITRCCVSDAVDGTKMFATSTKEVSLE